MTEHVLVSLISGTEYDDLNRILAKFIHHTVDQVKAFLVGQSGYDTDHHTVRISLQSEFFLQSHFIFYFFLAEVFDRVSSCNVGICCRIEITVINTIDNSRQAVCSCLHQSFQLLPIERCLDLFRIAAAYRCHTVSVDDSAFQIVGIVICFQLIR